MSTLLHNHSTQQRLLKQRRNAGLTDFDIIFGDRTFSCHNAFAVISSNTIASCVLSNDNSLIVDEDVDTTVEIIDAVVDSFYGVPLLLSHENGMEVFEFARFMGISSLQKLSKSAVKNNTLITYSNSLKSVLSELQNDQFRDFSLVYKNVRIKFHKFLLATLCPVFLSRFELQPGDNEWNFTNLLTVQESSFEEFFTSFYKDKITITLENLFDTSHLAFYFQMVSLESSCDSLMKSAEPLVSWIFPSLESADKADDLRFVNRLASVLVKVDDLAQSDPVAIKPDVFYKLCPNVNVFWLSTVLVHSYFHYDYNNQRVWTPNEVQKALNQIDTNTLTINQLYTIIKPLLIVEELYSVLSEFSLTRFTIEKSEIPSEWLVWLMVELDKNEPTNELNLTTRFASLLSKVFSKAKLSLIEPLVLHPKSFNAYLSNITQQYLILWFVRTLIISWKVSNHWTVEIFVEILSIVNLENVDSRELIAVLRPLETISDLFDFYCKFMTTKVTPLVIRDYARTSKELVKKFSELSASKQENEFLKKSKEELEREKVFERKRREEFEIKFQQEKVKNNDLQSENSKLKSIVDKDAEIIRRAEEEQERRRIEDEKRLEEERQQLLASYRSNPLCFIANHPNNCINVCGGKVKFLSETRGFNLTLSNDDLRVEKTDGGGDGSNSFIAINRPPTGKLILTNIQTPDCLIGLFDPSHAQGGSPHSPMSGIDVHSNKFLVILRGSQSHQRNRKITRIEVEFTQSNFKITLPQAQWSRDYDYEDGWVFGLIMWSQGQSWVLN
ncbi:hypothetical protein RCL1_004680 [Eukaryota sp. TZLM3-RCL]